MRNKNNFCLNITSIAQAYASMCEGPCTYPGVFFVVFCHKLICYDLQSCHPQEWCVREGCTFADLVPVFLVAESYGQNRLHIASTRGDCVHGLRGCVFAFICACVRACVCVCVCVCVCCGGVCVYLVPNATNTALECAHDILRYCCSGGVNTCLNLSSSGKILTI